MSRQQRRRAARADKKRVRGKRQAGEVEPSPAPPPDSAETELTLEKQVEHPLASVQARFEEALALHQLGKTEEAAAIYHTLLKEVPNHPSINHLFGVAKMQSGNFIEARKLIEHAISRI